MADDTKTFATNRKARHDFQILETYEAGLVLRGSEIKSIRAGQVSIREAYVKIENGEAWLINAHIATYDPASRENHDPLRPRKLLLHKKEIRKLFDDVRIKGVTVIPLQIYQEKGRAKIQIGVAKAKKLYDKRQDIARRDVERDLRREMKQ